MKSTLLFVFLFFSVICFAQKKTVDQKTIDSLLAIVDTIKTDSKKVTLLFGYTGKYRYTKKTKKLVLKSLEISLKSNDPENIAKSYLSLGNFQFYNTQLDSSLISLEIANKIISSQKNPTLKISILNSIGGTYKKKGDVPKAIATFLEAKKVLDNIDTLSLSKKDNYNHKGQRLVLNNALANFYNNMEEYETALSYYDKAYKAALKLNSKINAGAILSNKGDLLLKIGKHEEALKILLKSKEIKIEGGAHTRIIANSDLNIGIAYYKNNLLDSALSSFTKAYKIFSEIDNTPGLINVLNERGILYNKQKKYIQAKIDCERAKELSVSRNDLESRLNACNCLFKAYKGLGNYKKALENHELYLKEKDIIFNKRNIKKLTQLQMQYEFDKKEELQLIKIEKKEQERKLFLFISFMSLLIVLLLSFFFFKNRKKNFLLAKQKKMLEITVDEKNILLKETHHRVKNSFQIVSSLLYLQSESITNVEAQNAIKEAQNRVRSMVLIHQKLYSKDQLVGIDTHEYISDLVKDIMESHQFQNHSLAYTLNIEPLVLNIETITPIGLIINELIINVLKHAFNEINENSLLSVSLNKNGEELILKIQDNGKGFQEEAKETSFGIKLIKALSKKLKADLKFDSKKNKGTLATLTIKRFNTL